MASRRPTQAQIRERRARIAAVGLGVVFLAVAALQGPKLLKMINGGSSSSAPPPATTTSTTPGAAGTTTPGSTTVVAVGGQLHSFSLFNPVKPFKAIPKPVSPSSSSSLASGPAAKTAATKTPPATTTPTTTAANPPVTTTAAPSATKPTTTTTPAPPVTFTVPNGVEAAIVTVNGKKQLFGAGAMFPQDSPLFKLAAIAKVGLKISVLGGTFVDGQHYLVLEAGKKVTLLNQSDGSKFVIVYLKKTFAEPNQLTSPTQTSAAATTPSTTPPAPSATTTATTTG